LTNISAFAQDPPPSNLENEDLRAWLKSNWYDGVHNNLSWDNARISMYGTIDRADDGDVYCVKCDFSEPN